MKRTGHSSLVLAACLVACGPRGGEAGGSEAAGDETTGGDVTATSSPTTTSLTVEPGTTSATTGPEASSSSTADTEVPETCVPGTFVGLVSSGFESSGFQSCATGEWWWFDGAGNGQCPPELWVRVEGELCGPGHYGHLGASEYELRGDVVAGPCEAGCDGEPEPETCGSFQALCPFVECDAVSQDCGPRNRCVPTTLDDGPPWNGTQCVPAPDAPQRIGAACTSTAQWQDDCEAAAYCVTDDTGAGTCAEICDPSGTCGAQTCWPCDFVDEPSPVGVCGTAEVAC